MFYVCSKSKKNGKLYIGITSNLRKRFWGHNAGQVESTKYRRPFVLVYYEAYRAFKNAKKREKKLKHFKNTYKELKERISHSLSL